MISGGTLFLSNGIDTYVSMIQSLDLSRPLLFIIKILLGAPFAYHYFCGIRFCAWNAGKWLDMKAVYSTARGSLVLAAATSLLFALM
jgi:succinate dehydrogenase/fumarate reductase cytochrome b subunit